MVMDIKCPACHDVKLVGQSGVGLHLCKACCGPDADEFAFEILTRTIRDLQRANAFERACESVERYYEDKISALEAEINRLRNENVTSPQQQWIAEEENRRLFVCACVGDDARDLLRFIADAFLARTIVIDNIMESDIDESFPRWELMEDLLRNAVTHNPDAAAEMLVNILTHVGILEHGGNWLGSWTHGAHDKYLGELLGEGTENGNV